MLNFTLYFPTWVVARFGLNLRLKHLYLMKFKINSPNRDLDLTKTKVKRSKCGHNFQIFRVYVYWWQ
jgi:hypothetical protein